MKRIFSILPAVLAVCGLFAQHERPALQPISRAEAMDIVREEEEAKERAKDERDAELLSARIINTAVAQVGQKEVIFNHVKREPKASETSALETTATNQSENPFVPDPDQKERVSIVFSGTVWDETITEFWWDFGNTRYKVFANIDGSILSAINDLESEETRYSYFLILSQQSPEFASETNSEEWRPTLEDFPSNEIEYFVVQSSDDEVATEEALEPLILLLDFYRVNHTQLKTAHDNAQKIREARATYLELNPPKERSVIINYSHTKNSRYITDDQ